MEMKRRLVKQGERALTVTIPAAWAKKQHLTAGDEVDVFEGDTGLTITTEKKQPIKEIIVDASGLTPRLADRFIARAYQKGYDKITIKFSDHEVMKAIKDKVPELLGYEILNTEKNKVEIQVVSKQLDLDFDTMLRRALLLLMEMGQTCHDAWKSQDKKALEEIFYQDLDVNRFLYFCLRVLNTSQEMVSFGRSIIYYLIESLEDLGDELKALGKHLSDLPPDAELLQTISKMNEMFRLSYEFFYTPDTKKALRAYRLSKDIQQFIDEQLEKKPAKYVKVLVSIDFSVRVIYHLTTMRLDTLKELSGE